MRSGKASARVWGRATGLAIWLLALANAGAKADEMRRMTVGQAITIPLQGNPSTGYAWTLDTRESRGLDLVRVTEEGRVPEPPREAGKPPMPGQSSSFLWRVVALQPGEAVLVFSYARSWESVPPVRQERMTITISGR
jgi:predicted secreted protein